MGLRLQTTFYAEESGTAYTISIYDESYASSTIDFVTDSNGFVINWQGEGDDMKVPIVTSKCEVTIIIDSADVESFVTALSGAYEGQMRMKVTSGSSGVWYGHILPDLVQIEDKPIEQLPTFKLVATDGIKRLQKIPYYNAGSPYTGEESITQHLVNCINAIGLTDLMTEESGVLKSVTNWRPANRIAGDDMDHTYFDHRALYQLDDQGNYKYNSVYRVIEQLCYTFHCKFMMCDGWYWFIQHNEYENDTISPDEYDASKTALGATVVNSFTQVDSKFTGKFGTGYYSFFPALNQARVNYLHFGFSNIAQGYRWDQSSQPTIPESPTQYFMQDGSSFNFSALFYYSLQVTGDRPAFMKFGLTFQVDTNYLQRDTSFGGGGVVFEQDEEISATSADYELVIPVSVNTPQSPPTYVGSGNIPIAFSTIPFPTGGAVTFTIAYIGSYTSSGSLVSSGITGLNWSFSAVELTFLPDGNASSYTNRKSVIAQNTTTGNSESITVNKIIGQSLGFGKLRIDNGTASYEDGVDWGVGGTVANQSIEQLLAIEMIRTQSVPIKKMIANFQHSTYNPTLSIHHSANTWIFYKGKWFGAKEYFAAEWYLLDTTGTTSSEDETDWVLEGEEDEGNDVTPSQPDGGTPPIGGCGCDPVDTVSLLDALFPRTNDDIESGDTVTQIPVETRTVAGEWVAGQTITLVNQYTGQQQDFTVTADTAVSDTYISVSSVTASFQFPAGSWIITSQEQQAVSGSSGSFYREEFPAHASATITVTENSGNLPSNAAAIRVYYDNGQIISKNYWSHSGAVITLTYTPNGAQSIWVEFNT